MKKFLLLLMAVICVGALSAQTRTVTGTVYSAEDNEPLAGASVVPVGGKGQGTATDIDGHFSITVPQSVKQLTISYVGMVTKTVDIAPGEMSIVLTPSDNRLDEVMVVAFGTAKKQAFTGAAAVVKADQIEQHTTSNVANILAGTVPGLQMRGQSGAPGDDAGSFAIRGISSLYASSNPLIIVDGAPYDGNLNNIAPEDIESVSVLKDAASAALYGARGASGVIIFTTKKGSGEAKVSADLKWGVNQKGIQDYETIKDPAAYYEAYYAALNNYYLVNGYSAARANYSANSLLLSQLQYRVFDYPQGEMMIGMNGKLNPRATLGYQYTANNGVTYYLTPDDWSDLAYQNGFRQEYSMSVTGGSDKAAYYASLNFLDEDGFVRFSGYKRLTARLKGDFQVKRWMKLGANISYTHSDRRIDANMDGDNAESWGSTNLFYYTGLIAPIYPAFIRVVEDGQVVIKRDSQGNDAYDYGVSSTNYYGLNRPFLNTGNPLGSNRYNKNNTLTNMLNGTFTADFTFTDYLKANITSTVIWRNANNTDYENAFYGPKVGVNGELSKQSAETLTTNNIQTLTFVKSFGNNNVNAMVGHEYYYNSYRYLGAWAQGGFLSDVTEINAYANPTTSQSYRTQYNVEGFFLQGQYDYDEKYFAQVSYRRDASSRFARSHRWGNFWSLGGAWLINKDFLNDNKEVNLLKLKLSVGQQGNDNIGNYAYTDLYLLSKATDTSMAPTFYRFGNEDITWETTTNINAGLEFGFFNNRLNGEINVYNKRTSNLLFWLSVPESLGSRGYYGNIGTIRNIGVEATINGTILQGRDYQWTLSLNFSHNSTKVLKLPEAKITDNGGFYESGYWYAEGQPLYNNMTYAYAGINDQGQSLFYYDPDFIGADGTPITSKPAKLMSKEYVTTDPSKANRYLTGTALPKLFGGIQTTAQWKGIDVSMSFDYQIGGKIWDYRYQVLMSPPTTSSDAGKTFHVDYINSWTPANPDAKLPGWVYGSAYQYAGQGSDRWLTNASYLNFQQFTVGYTFPKKLFKNQAQLRIYCAGENLCFWSKRKGLDPRYSFDENSALSSYTPARTITGGIQVSF